jgi:hypothetical protein
VKEATERRPALVDEANLNLVADDACLVPREADGGILDEHAASHVVLPAMPGARHDVAAERSFAERPAAMETEIVDGVVCAVDVKERHPSSVHDDLACGARGDIADTRDGHELS